MNHNPIESNTSVANKPDFIYIYEVDRHLEHKQKLLKYIEKYISEKKDKAYSPEGYAFDYKQVPGGKPEYLEYLRDVVWPYISDVADIFYSFAPKVHAPWFQQYTQSTSHGWHNHPGSDFACVYLVECPDPKEATEFYGYGNFGAKEGNIIIFPSFLIHRSPPIKSNHRKTIFAFNFRTVYDKSKDKMLNHI
tara:strand:+ start:1871 stop:2446 length:576 start_codon:yes stop_codon:yes gene_type:complete